MRPSSATVTYSAVKDQLVSLSLEIEVRGGLLYKIPIFAGHWLRLHRENAGTGVS